MINLSLFLLSILYACSINKGSTIHEQLHEEFDDFNKINLTDGNYEIVQFWVKKIKIGDENGKEFRFKRSAENVTLRVRESSIIRYRTPVWLVYSKYSIQKADDNIIGDTLAIYEDPTLYVTIAHNIDYLGHAFLYGSLGHENIEAIPNRLARSLRKEKPHLFKETQEPGSTDESGEFTLSKYHVIYTPESPKNTSIILPPMGSPELFKKFEENYEEKPYERVKRSKKDIIYPEILLFLDYGKEQSTTRGSHIIKLLMYTITFWNSVNLRFMNLKDPEVRLRIAGIYVGMGSNALSFLKDNKHSGKVNAGLALLDVVEWAKSYVSLPWDFIITQTTSPIHRRDTENLLGLAFSKGSCNEFGRMRMAGIILDDMKYTGIPVAAHEIGHILGAKHDTEEGPDDCKMHSGYVMAQLITYNQHQFTWSRCSKEMIFHHLRNSESDCYDNDKPENDEGELVDFLVLPGYETGVHAQCEMRGYFSSCNSENVCKNLECREKWWFCTDTGPALDGTPCQGGTCRNGECTVDDY